jgi:hypothetical protein
MQDGRQPQSFTLRELLTRPEERIASNIPVDRLTRLEKAELVPTELRTTDAHVPAILAQYGG